jgi:hypothetical protein
MQRRAEGNGAKIGMTSFAGMAGSPLAPLAKPSASRTAMAAPGSDGDSAERCAYLLSAAVVLRENCSRMPVCVYRAEKVHAAAVVQDDCLRVRFVAREPQYMNSFLSRFVAI